MKKHKSLLITVSSIVIVIAIAFVSILLSQNILAKAAEDQKDEIMTEEQAVQTIGTLTDNEEQARITSAPDTPPGIPDNSDLAERLESAGASYELLEALNNPIPKTAGNELNSLLDQYESAPAGSDEQLDYLKQINEYVIPGANEALSGEVTKAEAIEIAENALNTIFDIDISNWLNQASINYMAKALYATNDGRSLWDIQGQTDTVAYYISIDAESGETISTNWMPLGESELSVEVKHQITQEQLEAFLLTGKEFIEKHLLKQDTSISNTTYEGEPASDGKIVINDTSIRLDFAISDGTAIRISIDINTNEISAISKTMVWDK